jgi:hypothetical protein
MKNRVLSLLPGLAIAALLFGTQAGCTARVSYAASTPPASLVAVGPGVWVVYDYHQPVFFSNGYYWLWSGGYWHQSQYVDYGFSRVHVSRVPPTVVRIDRPNAYVRYRGTGATRSVPPGHVRRSYNSAPARGREVDRRPPPSRGRGVDSRPPPGRGPSTAPPSRGRGTDAAPPPGRGPATAPPSRGRGTDAAPPPGRGPATAPPSRGRGTDAAPPPGRGASPAPASNGRGTSAAPPPSRGGGASPSRGGRR